MERGSLTSGIRTGEASQSRSRNEVFAQSVRPKLVSMASRQRCREQSRWDSLSRVIPTPSRANRTCGNHNMKEYHYIEHILKPSFEDMLIDEVYAKAIID